MKRSPLFVALLALLLAAPAGLAQVTDATENGYIPEPAAQDDIVATLDERGDFTILVDALRDTGLDDALAGGETYTLFAPTDAAFQALPAGTLENLTPEQLTGVLRYHVLVGAVPSQDAATLDSAPSVQGSELSLSTDADGLAVNGANVTETDVQASNGVIHVIDAVLIPEAGTPASMEDVQRHGGGVEKDSGEPAPAPEQPTPTDDLTPTDDQR